MRSSERNKGTDDQATNSQDGWRRVPCHRQAKRADRVTYDHCDRSDKGVSMSSDSSTNTPRHPFICQVNRQRESYYHHRFHSFIRPSAHAPIACEKHPRIRLARFPKFPTAVKPQPMLPYCSEPGQWSSNVHPLCVAWPELFADVSAPFGIQLRVDSKIRQCMDLPPLDTYRRPLCHFPLGTLTFMGSQYSRDDTWRLRSPRKCQREELSRLWEASRSGTEFMYRLSQRLTNPL